MLSEWSQKINLRGETKVWPNHWVGSIDDDIAGAFIIASGKGRAIGALAPEATEIVDLMRQVIESLTVDNINPTFEAVVHSIAVMHENSVAAGEGENPSLPAGTLVVAGDSPDGEPAAIDGAPSTPQAAPVVRRRKAAT